MSRQSSDFRAGVEAAAKWLRATKNRDRLFMTEHEMAEAMLAAVAEDPEGTEARTVAQIVQYIREWWATGKHLRDETGSVLDSLAEDIEQNRWKLK